MNINFVVWLFIAPVVHAHQASPVIKTNLGLVRGEILKSRLNNDFYAFRGIRYAEPPIGIYKFQQAKPIKPWHNIFNATKDGPACPQLTKEEVAEDCLHLNIYTKNIENNIANKMSSVIVFIYGGALVSGSNALNRAGPENIIDRDIVLVVINYRVGVFGFLSTGTKDCTGNAGFKDQVLALRWTQNHIAAFGGNPKSVTIMGQSAGARSVALHLISKMSQGLFHRAIVMSGSATAQWKVQKHQLETVETISKYLNCPKTNLSITIACLKSASMEQLLSSLNSITLNNDLPFIKFFPVSEDERNQEVFLVDDPNTLFKKGEFYRVPLLVGITEDEWAGPAITLLRNEKFRDEINQHFQFWAPIIFLYERNSNRSIEITKRITKEFFSDNLTVNSTKNFISFLSEAVTTFGVHRFVHLVESYTIVFYYKVSYVGRYSRFYLTESQPYGVAHGDDLQYLIIMKNVTPKLFKISDPESLQVERMTRMWSNFAINGDPNDPNDNVIGNISWTRFNSKLENYLNIGNELIMENNLNFERLKKWDKIFPIDSSGAQITIFGFWFNVVLLNVCFSWRIK